MKNKNNKVFWKKEFLPKTLLYVRTTQSIRLSLLGTIPVSKPTVMTRYKNYNKNSGIHSYEIRPGSIIIKFTDGEVYLYTYASTGKQKINQMQQLAKAGKGLSTFINRHVREKYEKKIVRL